MALKDFQARVVANACITRVNNGEGTIEEVTATYKMTAEDRVKVLAHVYVLRPDLQEEETPSAA
ncbi:hypothetical protein [Paenibacillus pseudetheri]|uniref:Uncharacterized protein n=1 Tax=Paenibacillus pseudetheri TaxID=2897682 RepID=A0ABN8FPM3_9BACL|nr:hypothetical protein [Paenibacillus pseudetheri]CAH1057633.1 hypothetical protein PAECIP111894_03791 [Paenibacillus pseudetheri]